MRLLDAVFVDFLVRVAQAEAMPDLMQNGGVAVAALLQMPLGPARPVEGEVPLRGGRRIGKAEFGGGADLVQRPQLEDEVGVRRAIDLLELQIDEIVVGGENVAEGVLFVTLPFSFRRVAVLEIERDRMVLVVSIAVDQRIQVRIVGVGYDVLRYGRFVDHDSLPLDSARPLLVFGCGMRTDRLFFGGFSRVPWARSDRVGGCERRRRLRPRFSGHARSRGIRLGFQGGSTRSVECEPRCLPPLQARPPYDNSYHNPSPRNVNQFTVRRFFFGA